MSETLTNDAFLGFRAPAELVEALDVAAAKACRSRSQEMRFRLEQSFETGLVGVEIVSRKSKATDLSTRTYEIKDGVLDPSTMREEPVSVRSKPCPHRVPAGSFCARCGS